MDDNDVKLDGDISVLQDMQTLYIKQEVKIKYKVSDKWFILTVVFSTLTGVGLMLLLVIALLYRKKKIEYKNFMRHKQRKLMSADKKYGEGHRNLSMTSIGDFGGGLFIQAKPP